MDRVNNQGGGYRPTYSDPLPSKDVNIINDCDGWWANCPLTITDSSTTQIADSFNSDNRVDNRSNYGNVAVTDSGNTSNTTDSRHLEDRRNSGNVTTTTTTTDTNTNTTTDTSDHSRRQTSTTSNLQNYQAWPPVQNRDAAAIYWGNSAATNGSAGQTGALQPCATNSQPGMPEVQKDLFPFPCSLALDAAMSTGDGRVP